VLDLLAPTKDAAVTQSLAQIRNSVRQQTAPKYDWIKKALLPLLDAADNDLAKAQKNVENWFDDSMERVTGWYKRRTQLYLIILALPVCVVMNVDTFAIANSLYRDNALRSMVVAAAEKRAKEPLQTTATPSPPTKAGEKAPPAPAAAKAKSPEKGTEVKPSPISGVKPPVAGKETPPAQAAAVAIPTTKKDQKTPNPIQEAIIQVQDLNLPIGWVVKSGLGFKDENDKIQEIGFPYNLVPVDRDIKSTDNKAADPRDPKLANPKNLKLTDPNDLFPWNIGWFKILGWLFTVLAVSLGAPFWFDLLNKLVNLRGAGKKPEPAAKKE
jgi:hypothetical protein